MARVKALIVKAKHDVVLPVEPGHAFFEYQSFRIVTDEEIEDHRFFGRILKQRAKKAENEATELAINKQTLVWLRWRIGPIITFQAPQDFEVQNGGLFTYNAAWTELIANNVTIRPGGVLKVVSPVPSIPATFKLECNSLGSG
jgi:hypothetical protein